MKNRQGFTLIELLVVMAIITILAAIAIPNVINYINQGQATRARADIQGIETALTEVLADAGRSSLEQLFNPAGVSAFMVTRTQAWPPVSAEDFRRATQLYTRALTGILRAGRNILGTDEALDPSNPGLGRFNYSQVLQADVVRRLGQGYIDIGPDPWGNLYNIYPGPWAARIANPNAQPGEPASQRAPIPFRIFTLTDAQRDLPGSPNINTDVLVIPNYADPENLDEQFTVGYPAQSNQIAFIWSNGANLVSSQVLYSGFGYNGPSYDPNQDEIFRGGGDDINNWDSGGSWGRFY